MAIEDIIWGKNRHVFGGIEPSNMVEFIVEPSTNGMLITATPPGDTVIDGQTVCTVAGVTIRRRSDRYPEDEFDGDEVVTIHGTKKVVCGDTSVDSKGTYYYSAFPFSTQNVYNRNPANRVTANEPANLDMFRATCEYNVSTDSFNITLSYVLPSTIAGAVIVGSTTGYPETPADGVEIMNSTSSGSYILDTFDGNAIEDGGVYYFSAFPYSNNGAYNYNPVNRTTTTARKYSYYYGYDIVLDDSNPDTRVIYDVYEANSALVVDNLNYDPVGIDENSGTFSYGSWEKAGFMPKPCMLKYDGVVAYYLNPNDYSKKEDGTESDIANSNFGANAMMEWPKIWTKRWESIVDGHRRYHFRCSDTQLDDDYECWCNYDRNGNQIPYFYTSIYIALSDNVIPASNCARSLSGIYVNSTWYYSPYSFFNSEIASIGDDWTPETLSDRLLINDLLVLMGRSTNLERVYGNGSCGTGWANYTTGMTDSDGLFSGHKKIIKNDTHYPLKIFGMEDWWGRGWRYLVGWIETEDKKLMLKLTRNTNDGSTATDYNFTGNGYIYDDTTLTSKSGAKVDDCVVRPYGRFPINASGGSLTTYECDGFYRPTTTGLKVLCVGGIWPTTSTKALVDSDNGPFNATLTYTPNVETASVKTGLSCKPAKL